MGTVLKSISLIFLFSKGKVFLPVVLPFSFMIWHWPPTMTVFGCSIKYFSCSFSRSFCMMSSASMRAKYCPLAFLIAVLKVGLTPKLVEFWKIFTQGLFLANRLRIAQEVSVEQSSMAISSIDLKV